MIEVTAAALPYQQPGIVGILVFSSLFLLLNIIGHVLDRLLFCGLIGQIFLGVAFGTPGTKWLDTNSEAVIVQLGYLGLILLVYEGGLSTSYQSLKSNLPLSTAVALTGIILPIALSFSLQALAGASSLQSFAAGAALCSTSLGTTLTVLTTSGLTNTRLGVILSSAAILDDVVGLVMVQIISNLGGSATSFSAITVIRPVFVSLAFVVFLPLLCCYAVAPLTLWLNTQRQKNSPLVVERVLCSEQTVFLIHTAVLLLAVTGASFAGTSNLFAAYLAGASISWWDSELPHSWFKDVREDIGAYPSVRLESAQSCVQNLHGSETHAIEHHTNPIVQPPYNKEQDSTPEATSTPSSTRSGALIYEKYYAQPVHRILKPLFFASIGFSIPITRLFSARIVWRGIVYAILMATAKLACGLWLVRLPPRFRVLETLHRAHPRISPCHTNTASAPPLPGFLAPIPPPSPALHSPAASSIPSRSPNPPPHDPPNPLQPPLSISIYPPAILGSAMVARGEIGLLVSSLAASRGVFSSADATAAPADELFLVVTWAVVLCTVVGPLGVGALVRGWRRGGGGKG
ncbi:hypothetical protein MMC11_006827 [Xylographa trunciseda]|nr:hypothetical protein [Xylographa trunciseda]